MAGNLTNKPKILHGAFVEYGLTIPPLFVGFQFNPVELSRSRSLSFKAPNDKSKKAPKKDGKASLDQEDPLRKYHATEKSLSKIQQGQVVTVQEETISFDIRFDATDKLNEGDKVAGQFGIAPQLATLELMVLPKNESLLGGLVGELLDLGSSLLSKGKKKGKKKSKGFSFTKLPNPPLVLFVWGRKKVLPVNINSLNIKESELSPDLNPIRATVSVNLTVIEGKSSAYKYSKAMTEAMSVANLASVTDVVNVVIPV